MKKQVSPVLMVAAIVLVVAVIGFFGFRAITPQVDDPRAPTPEAMKARMTGGGGGGGSNYGSAARPRGAGGPPGGYGRGQYSQQYGQQGRR